MAFFDTHGAVPTGLVTYRMKVFMRTISGVGVNGLAPAVNIWRARNNEIPPVQIFTAGVASAGQTFAPINATNMPGLYELRLAATDLDRPGSMVLRIVGAGGAVDTYLHVPVLAREALTGGI